MQSWGEIGQPAAKYGPVLEAFIQVQLGVGLVRLRAHVTYSTMNDSAQTLRATPAYAT